MYPSLKPLLKNLVKQKGLSYRELGRKIGISESGVKKLFQAEDCSLSRLHQITTALEVDLASLMLQVQMKTPIELVEIDEKAQAVLRKNPQLMDIYWLLFIEDMTPAEILDHYKIPQSSLYKCLNELERLKLVIWKPGDKVSAAPKCNFLVKPSGPMVQHWMRRFSESIIEDVVPEGGVGPSQENGGHLAQRFLHLNSESVLDLKQRLEELIMDFSLRSTREKTFCRNRTVPVRVFTSYALGSMIKKLQSSRL